MHYIRRIESKAAEMYRLRFIYGFLHLYIGQEAIATGMKPAISEKDALITSYRCHGFAVVLGISARHIFAELMGRTTGTSKGKGGSMHMYGEQFYGGEGIVGGQLPVGTGLAFAQKYNSTGGIAWVIYGDGAADQGQAFEAYNLAKLWSLPVVYVCENNKYSMGTATYRHSANTDYYTRGDLIPGVQVDGMKVLDVYEAARFAKDYALRKGPIILEMVTYRYFGHSMADPGTSYRSREEVKLVQAKQDPIKWLTKQIIDNGLKTQEEIETYENEELEIAKNDPTPDITDVGLHLYAKPLEKVRGKVPWESW
ncbi:pyruvate dehydrogenase E1 component subunit alpha, mitochondrial-like [Apis florea]|uniref:pyruvate dehydrogenase E1 component subunit alpha, mitochondrial-like n=1 Tax=Apis florea TaxID=7463 RepID=UPI0012FEF1BC|nr:pyruvate dehydrogenase E1 component subunit alpha, mitochondrial-like [Apis florea]